MPNYISVCPGCDADKHDISWAAAYFDVYKCKDCGEEYCHKCRGSNGARYCPACKSTSRDTYGRVSKP